MRQEVAAGRGFGATLSAVVAAFAFFFFVDPSSSPVAPPCLFHALFGVTCPGCGSLRALHALLHGDVGRAWDLNRLLVTGLVIAPAAALLARRRR